MDRARGSRAGARADTRGDGPYKNLKLPRDSDGIAALLVDRARASANRLSAEVMEEFDAVLHGGGERASCRSRHALGKTSGFIPGAESTDSWRDDPEWWKTAIGTPHAIVDRLESLKLPRVA